MHYAAAHALPRIDPRFNDVVISSLNYSIIRLGPLSLRSCFSSSSQ